MILDDLVCLRQWEVDKTLARYMQISYQVKLSEIDPSLFQALASASMYNIHDRCNRVHTRTSKREDTVVDLDDVTNTIPRWSLGTDITKMKFISLHQPHVCRDRTSKIDLRGILCPPSKAVNSSLVHQAMKLDSPHPHC